MRQRFVTPENKKWWTLGAVAVGLFMIMLDNTVVNVALPSMRRSLGLSLSQLEWIVAGYALTFAAFMLTGGKLADLLGRRRIFMAGLVVFTGASLACGLATSGGFLIGARVVQGFGGALINPATLSIIAATFPPQGARQGDRDLGRRLGHGPRDRPARRRPAHRARQLELDLLHQRPDRHRRPARDSVPGRRVARHVERAAPRRPRARHLGGRPVRAHVRVHRGELLRLDVDRGSSARSRSPRSRSSRSSLLELRQRLPMLDLSLFRNRTFSGANTAMLFVGLAMFGTFFYVSLYMQNVLGYSPVQSGASFLPMTCLIILIAPRAGKLSDRFGSRWLVGGGMGLLAIMLFYYSRLGEHASVLGAAARPADRRHGHGADDDAHDRRRDELGAGRQGRRRLCRPELDAAGRRLARDRRDGRRRRLGVGLVARRRRRSRSSRSCTASTTRCGSPRCSRWRARSSRRR